MLLVCAAMTQGALPLASCSPHSKMLTLSTWGHSVLLQAHNCIPVGVSPILLRHIRARPLSILLGAGCRGVTKVQETTRRLFPDKKFQQVQKYSNKALGLGFVPFGRNISSWALLCRAIPSLPFVPGRGIVSAQCFFAEISLMSSTVPLWRRKFVPCTSSHWTSGLEGTAWDSVTREALKVNRC